MIFQRKNKGSKANPRGAGNKDRQGKVGGGQSRRFSKEEGRNPGPSMLLTSPTQKELRRAGAFPMIFQLVELLPTDPIEPIGGQVVIFSQLQISETDRNVCQCVLSADVRERRYKSESN